MPDGLNQYTYRQQNGQIAKINSINQTRSCAIFLDKATCKHLIAASIKDKLNIDGYPIFPKKLLTLRQRKRKQYLDASIEAANQVVDQAEVADQVEGDRVQIGRPTLAGNALSLDNLPKKIRPGRPPGQQD